MPAHLLQYFVFKFIMRERLDELNNNNNNNSILNCAHLLNDILAENVLILNTHSKDEKKEYHRKILAYREFLVQINKCEK